MTLSNNLRAMSVAIVLAMALPAAVHAQPKPDTGPRIQAFSLDKTQALGAAMYAQDQAAWKASDLMAAAKPNLTGYVGWLTSPYQGGQRVRWIKGSYAAPEAGYEVVLDGKTPPRFVASSDSKLTPDEAAQARALDVALAGAEVHNCTKRSMNHIELRDPDTGEWLVWIMSPWTDEDGIAMGGHTRVTVSADGSKIIRQEQMSRGCLGMKPPPRTPGGDPPMMVVIQLVADTPLETHVFNALQSHTSIVVGTPDKTIWLVDGQSIENGGKLDEKPARRR